VTTQGAPADAPQPPLVYTISNSNSTDTGSAAGPLYITESPLNTPMADYRLDYAQVSASPALVAILCE